METFKVTIETLISGKLTWAPSETYTRLLHLAFEGNEYFLYLMNHYANSDKKLPNECIQFLKQIEKSLSENLKYRKDEAITPILLSLPDKKSPTITRK